MPLIRNGDALRKYLIWLSLIVVCAIGEASGIDGSGEKIASVISEDLKSIDKDSILVIDYGNNSKKIKPVSEFPESIRFKPRRESVNGVEVVVRIPVRGIIITPLSKDGKIVDASESKIVNVQYLDENGSVLESTTMHGK